MDRKNSLVTYLSLLSPFSHSFTLVGVFIIVHSTGTLLMQVQLINSPKQLQLVNTTGSTSTRRNLCQNVLTALYLHFSDQLVQPLEQ